MRAKNIGVPLALALAVLALGATHSVQAEQALSPDMTAMLTLKVLTLDRNLASRASGEVVAGIVYAEQDGPYAKELRAAFDKFKDKKVSGLGFRTVSTAYTDLNQLKAWMAKEKVTVLFLSPGMVGHSATIHQAAVESKCLTAGGDGAFPAAGTSLGFETSDGKPRIVINLERSKQEGVDFSAALLQMARVL